MSASPGFSAKPISIGRLLADPYVFRIPSFQRPFSWTTKEAGQLLDDLLTALKEARESGGEDDSYFLGEMLITEPEPWSAEAGSASLRLCDIVDGQQRLVTLTILAAVLRDLMAAAPAAQPTVLGGLIECRANGVGGRRFRVELRGNERDAFRVLVQETGSSNIVPESEAPGDAEGRIVAVRDLFRNELSQRSAPELMQLASFVAERCYVALLSVHSLDRAHRMFIVLNDRGRPLDRKDILKAQILGQIEARMRPSALAIWDRIEALLGDDFENLFSHIRAVEGRPRLPIISGIMDVMTRVGGAHAFVEKVLEPYGLASHAISHPQQAGAPQADAVRRSLVYLGWLGSSDWIPPALLWWCRNSNDPGQLAAFMVQLERLAYCLRLLGVGADKRQARFAAVIDAIRAGTALDARRGPFTLSRDEQRNILFNLRNLHARSPLTCKLVLMRLNDELAGTLQGLSPSDFTVEHVLPQKPQRASAWRNWFPSADEREGCTNSLGNLVLVTRAQNDRARNMDFARKMEVYFGSPDMRVPHLTAEIRGAAEWRAPQVLAREERLVALVKRIWALEGPRTGTEPPAMALAGRSARG